MRSGQQSNGDRDEHRSIAGQIGPQLLQPAGHHLGPKTWSDYAGFHRAAGSIGGALKRDYGLEAGDRVAGPAAIVEPQTTTWLTSSHQAVMQSDGCLLVTRPATDLSAGAGEAGG